MMKQISCPNCKGNLFVFGIIDNNAYLFHDGEKFSTQNSENNVHMIQLQCRNCQHSFNLEDPADINALINQKKTCSECGREFNESDLDENGICDICRLKKIDPSFADIENQGDFTMVRLIAKLSLDNHRLSDQNIKLQEELKKAEEVKEKISNAEAKQEEKPKKRGRSKKKESVEEVQNENTIDIDAEETVDSDIEITEDTAPEIPDNISEMSKEISETAEEFELEREYNES